MSSSLPSPPLPPPTSNKKKKMLVLHGNRQTGQLLLGRMDKLRKRFQRKPFEMELVAIDAPFPVEILDDDDDSNNNNSGDTPMRTWWRREEDQASSYYAGLDQTFATLQDAWTKDDHYCGILGFSQGARLAHLMAVAHQCSSHANSNKDKHHNNEGEVKPTPTFFPGLQFVILVAGYDAPYPENWNTIIPGTVPSPPTKIRNVPSLHVWGETDALITPEQSHAVTQHYHNPTLHIHPGGHHVPMRAENVKAYLNFIQTSLKIEETGGENGGVASSLSSSSSTVVASQPIVPVGTVTPDEECLQAQIDEVEALEAIYPDEFQLLSKRNSDRNGTKTYYQHPIRYKVQLPSTDTGVWPPRPLALEVVYPPDYPMRVSPTLRLIHNNNVMEFSTAQSEACASALAMAAKIEIGMPCVLSCIQAAHEFFESGVMSTVAASSIRGGMVGTTSSSTTNPESDDDETELLGTVAATSGGSIRAATPGRIQECNVQGLEIAEALLRQRASERRGKGGSWTYTIGLVGKPSAGKSTFFNVATAFARQRDDPTNALGGANMAPHPFTTIDPNVGVCLVPAPEGSCPEDSYHGNDLKVGSTHGRDHRGRRLLPVLLKDVAGLVPGAYQGRGRGNKFLNDLTDADVLVHVLDGSGTADTEGNAVGVERDGQPSQGGSHPLQDLAWIRNELIEWVYSNVMYKWDIIRARGPERLAKMFSGYGQTQAVTMDVLSAVEKYLETVEQRERALSNLYEWDEGDVHRLVSAFLGVRFPMALAINKYDISTSKKHADDILAALPIHGAHVGVPMCAHREMLFVRRTICQAQGKPLVGADEAGKAGKAPEGVWNCLQGAMALNEPDLVFPVADFSTYAPLPGMTRYATEDASLPNVGMVACMLASGGTPPSLWNPSQKIYTAAPKNAAGSNCGLRDVLIMKPGSTVEDCYLTLKRLGALSGDFVRAEACSDVGVPPKPLPKHQTISKSSRILKIMTKKKTAWQGK